MSFAEQADFGALELERANQVRLVGVVADERETPEQVANAVEMRGERGGTADHWSLKSRSSGVSSIPDDDVHNRLILQRLCRELLHAGACNRGPGGPKPFTARTVLSRLGARVG